MARLGYVEARLRFEQAERALESSLRIKAQSPDLFVDKPDPWKTRELENLLARQLEYDTAKVAFDVFAPAARQKRVYYPRKFWIHMGTSKELGDAIEKQTEAGVSLADLTRDALTAYLLPEEP